MILGCTVLLRFGNNGLGVVLLSVKETEYKMEFFPKGNADLVAFTKETFNGNLFVQ